MYTEVDFTQRSYAKGTPNPSEPAAKSFAKTELLNPLLLDVTVPEYQAWTVFRLQAFD